ncbi:hypothetical protein T552_04136 [Pneumocystis carinii B80]|uniref:Uncharacterized protein n=1 Tax=Pneumocystis carinii (strain B80) TaxID=1408658 RepID=A0A0W4ZI78_PNEC8|nr:hypothetical protein T552_04136 [Pneumocystis carinii B80]KTW28075.1 hypothetical protein T552_04136 [Pneumocystis carinii B80]
MVGSSTGLGWSGVGLGLCGVGLYGVGLYYRVRVRLVLCRVRGYVRVMLGFRARVCIGVWLGFCIRGYIAAIDQGLRVRVRVIRVT